MREIRESVALDVPQARAEQCILQFFDRYRRPDGRIEIPLRVDLRRFGLPGGLQLERSVTVRIEKRRDASNLNEELAVHWSPGPGQPFPAFSGAIATWSESGATSFAELRGTYEPPLGSAGRLFDDAVGHVVAQRTVHQFLQMLAEGARTCFRP